MKTAFLVLAHEAPDRLATLVRDLKGPRTGVFVHLDRRASRAAFERSFRAAGTQPDLLVHQHAVIYSSYRMIEATLPLLKAAADAGHEYFVLLGGLDVPLRPVGEVLSYLGAHGDRSFIRHEPIPTDALALRGIPRTRYYSFIVGNRNETLYPFGGHGRHLSLRGKLLNALLWVRNRGRVRRAFPLGMQPYYCSQWWNLSRAAAEKILHFLDRHPEYARYHRHALHPEEMFFQSIVLNDPDLKPTVVNDDLRFVGWVPGEKHPRTLGSGDLATLQASGALFARKVEDSAAEDLRRSILQNEGGTR